MRAFRELSRWGKRCQYIHSTGSCVNHDTVILRVDFAAVGFLRVEFIPGIQSTVLRGGADSCVYFYSARERCVFPTSVCLFGNQYETDMHASNILRTFHTSLFLMLYKWVHVCRKKRVFWRFKPDVDPASIDQLINQRQLEEGLEGA